MKLTELEGTVLGIVWRRGPCSPYAVKREFELSPSASWSASAGAIYPLIGKLERLGLLEARKEAWGAREKKLVNLSPAGEAELTVWLSSLPEWTGRVTPDPIRTRAYFLDLLRDQKEQLKFLAAAEENSRLAARQLEKQIEALDSRYERLATLGSLLQVKARLRWIRMLRRELLQSNRS